MALDQTLMQALSDAMPEPVLVVSADGRVLVANPPSRHLFPALRAGDLLALNLRSPVVLDGMASVRAERRAESVIWLDRVPVERLFEVNIALLAATGDDDALVLTMRDLTEARRVERMRVDFIANASHELRTPLASLLGFIETLQGAARDDPRARERFLGIMHEQAQRMARLVDDLLSLSRIEQNQHVRPDAPVDLVTIVRHIADTLARMARENRVTLDVRSDAEVVVPGDRDDLLRVAENLIENAIKYSAPLEGATPVPVEISVSVAGGRALFSVRDYGPGIAREHLPRLTERFYRIDAGQSRAKGGTGLGLAIVKHIVARHRGRLLVDSEPGQGATFTAVLPLFGDN